MLDFMRRHHSKLKWVWAVVIFITAVGMIVLYIPFGDSTAITITSDVARVGDEAVSAREFQMAYKNYMQRMQSQLPPEVRKAFGFEKQVLDALIAQHVVSAQAKRVGLQVSPMEIEQKVLSNPVFLDQGKFIGFDRYQLILSQNNLTVEEFEKAVRNEILNSKLLSFVTAGVTLTDKEDRKSTRLNSSHRTISYAVIRL